MTPVTAAIRSRNSAGDTASLEVYRPDGTVTVEITWGAAPREEQAENAQSQQGSDNGNGDYSYGYGNGGMNPFDMFRYFFG